MIEWQPNLSAPEALPKILRYCKTCQKQAPHEIRTGSGVAAAICLACLERAITYELSRDWFDRRLLEPKEAVDLAAGLDQARQVYFVIKLLQVTGIATVQADQLAAKLCEGQFATLSQLAIFSGSGETMYQWFYTAACGDQSPASPRPTPRIAVDWPGNFRELQGLTPGLTPGQTSSGVWRRILVIVQHMMRVCFFDLWIFREALV
jgi:hypothetical protein